MIPTAWLRLTPGMRFGRLTVVEKTAQKDKWGKCYLWRCRSDCGREALVSSSRLRNGNIRSCGCLQAENRERDLTGQRFGRLVAQEPTGEVRGHSRVWRCLCDCGQAAEARGRSLTDGSIRPCGCLQREVKAAQAVAMQAGCGRVEGTSLSSIASHSAYGATGVRGVSWHAGCRKYVARITLQGVTRSLGYHDTLESATSARKAAEEELFAPILKKHAEARRKNERKPPR